MLDPTADMHTEKKLSNLFSLHGSTRRGTDGRIGCNPHQNLVAALGQYTFFIICLQSLQLSSIFYFALCRVKTIQVLAEIAVLERNKDKAKNESVTNVNRNKNPRESGNCLFRFCCYAFLFYSQ